MASWTALIVGGFAGFLFAAVYGITLMMPGRVTSHQEAADRIRPRRGE